MNTTYQIRRATKYFKDRRDYQDYILESIRDQETETQWIKDTVERIKNKVKSKP